MLGELHTGAADRARSAVEPAHKLDRHPALLVGLARMDVHPVDRGRVDLDEDLVVSGSGLGDFRETEDFRWPIPVINDGSHVPVLPWWRVRDRRIGLPCFQRGPGR